MTVTRRALVLYPGIRFCSCLAPLSGVKSPTNFEQFSGKRWKIKTVSVPISYFPSQHRCRTLCNETTAGRPKMELVYSAPLKNAVIAIKIFSLSTAALAFVGAPVMVFMGKASVSLVAKLFMSSVVMFASLGSTALLHWIIKGTISTRRPFTKSQWEGRGKKKKNTPSCP